MPFGVRFGTLGAEGSWANGAGLEGCGFQKPNLETNELMWLGDRRSKAKNSGHREAGFRAYSLVFQ